jgi:hypothetical protein
MSEPNPPNQLTECDVDNCPGVCEEASLLCVISLAAVHPTCFTTTISKLSEYPGSSNDEVFCSDVCCLWHGKEGVDVEGIRDERSKLLALKKKQLVKLASILQVWVTYRINGASRQISKPMMVRRLVAAKFGASVEQASTPSHKGPSKKKHKTTADEPITDEPTTDKVVYCSLMLEPLDGSRQTNIGFIRVNSGRVNFLGARAQIMREIESIFLPQTWSFFIPTLGSISPVQEAEIVIFDLFDESANVVFRIL